ncbi:MAG: LamG domain-containing protein, partial [bacterium]
VEAAVELKNEIERLRTSAEVTAAEFILTSSSVDSPPKTNKVTKVIAEPQRVDPLKSLRGSLVLYYSFDGSLGKTVMDKSGKGHEGRVHGAKWTQKGKVGGACEFSGKGNCISIPDSPKFDFGTSDFTISAWISPRKNAQTAIVGKSTANDRGYFFTQERNGLQFLAGAGGDWSVNTHSSSGLTLNAWNHVVVSQDSGRICFWIDGVSCGGGRGGTVNGDATDLLIGGSSWADYLDFKGLIDEVMIFDRALSAEEVKQIYDAQRGRR